MAAAVLNKALRVPLRYDGQRQQQHVRRLYLRAVHTDGGGSLSPWRNMTARAKPRDASLKARARSSAQGEAVALLFSCICNLEVVIWK